MLAAHTRISPTGQALCRGIGLDFPAAGGYTPRFGELSDAVARAVRGPARTRGGRRRRVGTRRPRRGPAGRATVADPPKPGVLDRPLDPEPADTAGRAFVLPTVQLDPPLGFAGPSGVLPRSGNSPEFETVEDRWRIGLPDWDRYGQGHPRRARLPVPARQRWEPVQPERPQGRLPDHRPAHVPRTSRPPRRRSSRPAPSRPPTTPFESTAPRRAGGLLRHDRAVRVQPALPVLGSTCSTATRRSSRSTGGSR